MNEITLEDIMAGMIDYEKQQKWIHSTEYLKLVNESLKKKGLLYDTKYA